MFRSDPNLSTVTYIRVSGKDRLFLCPSSHSLFLFYRWQIQVSFPCQVLQATMLSILFSYLENVEYQQWLSLRHCWLLYEAILAECDGSACREGSLPNENLPASLFPLGSELHNWRVSRASQALLTRYLQAPLKMLREG